MQSYRAIIIGATGRWRSVVCAARGVRLLLRREPNARIHAVATGSVAIGGFAMRLSVDEWRWLILACALVWTAEAFNTAVERLCDRVCPDQDALMGAAKDVAAGGVLIAAAAALLLGLTVFLPHLAGAWR
jgi:diacylglycerol kinase (ATP)